MPYKIIDHADGVAGHYCVAKSDDGVYWRYWSEWHCDWISAGTVYHELNYAVAVLLRIVQDEHNAENDRLKEELGKLYRDSDVYYDEAVYREVTSPST